MNTHPPLTHTIHNFVRRFKTYNTVYEIPKRLHSEWIDFGQVKNANLSSFLGIANLHIKVNDHCKRLFGFSRNASCYYCRTNLSNVLPFFLVSLMRAYECGLRVIILNGHWHWMEGILDNLHCGWVHQTVYKQTNDQTTTTTKSQSTEYTKILSHKPLNGSIVFCKLFHLLIKQKKCCV